MGIVDAFSAEDRVQVKFSTFHAMMKACCETEILMRGIKCDVPHRYLREMISGEKEENENEIATPVAPPDYPFSYLFESEEEMRMYAIADKDHLFVLTDEGYLHTPAHLRYERSVGVPVPGFKDKVPLSWLDKGYVVLVEKSCYITAKIPVDQEDDLK